MLKSLLYYVITFSTALRFTVMVYLFSRDNANLPVSVIVVTSVMIIFGAVIIAKKFIGGLNYKHLVAFFLVQAGMVVFNILNVAIFSPLQISAAETFIVGSFLDILIDFIAVYACVRYSRSAYRPFVRVVHGVTAGNKRA